MTPEQFVKKWAGSHLGELQSYQMHFADVCRLVGHVSPGGDGKTDSGETFVFEHAVKTGQGSHGYADVYYEGHFAIEYKAADKYKDLSAAYNQLLRYREALKNPPLLVVTDINHWEIHTNFPNTSKAVYRFTHAELPGHLDILRDMFHAPERLHPRRQAEQVTQDAARAFEKIADNMRQWDAEPERIAYFLTKLVFCLFAEDIGLLPPAFDSPDGIFTHIVEHSRKRPGIFQQYVRNLFVAMNDGGDFLMQDIRYFNGTLFQVVTVEELSIEAIDALAEAARLDWANIEPSIFGTLFERSLDPAKRSQLGAHYTSRDDILLIVEPVLMQPLRYAWDTVQLEAEPIRQRYDKATTGRDRANAARQLLALRAEILEKTRSVKVLDPACGSGNFLYVSLQMLMDLEKEIIQHPLWTGLQMPAPAVHPRQMYGIEINPIAHALASIVVWIGFIQWRYKNGYHNLFSDPILEKLEENIVCKDAILPPSVPPKHQGDAAADQDRRGEAVTCPHETGVDWPEVDVIVGNPPFLGGFKMRSELGDVYIDRLHDAYRGRVKASADLVTYWYENARDHIERGFAKRAGFLATNSIRDGASREVLERIKSTGDIFMAWSDRDWILDGAAVRISMVGFDNGDQLSRILNGIPVIEINPDLTAGLDITISKKLASNSGYCMWADKKGGPFDIPGEQARQMLAATNASGLSNADVLFPRPNGIDVTRRPRDIWIIDFGVDASLEDAKRYELPFAHVKEYVKPARASNRIARLREKWWIHREPSAEMRSAIRRLPQFIATPRVAKHRLFVWLEHPALPDDRLYIFPRSDDYFFGVLHSKLHEVWSLRHGSTLEDRPHYTPTTTFETFPFPWSPSHEDTSHPAHARISAAAKQLHQERHAWLHPAAASAKVVNDRTLTNLYNALQVYRGESSIKVKPAAGDFAPRLDELHRELDEAVCDAYGWGVEVLDDEEEILRRLLALNLERAGDS